MVDTSAWINEDPKLRSRREELILSIKNACDTEGGAMTTTSLPLPGRIQGKVRDIYEVPGNRLGLVATDRQSAFDRILAAVPFKGQVLNLISAWWFEKTAHIIPNHVLSVPHPNVTIAAKCTVFPVEVVVRGYITGSTSTSLWTHYNKGERRYCGLDFPDGLVKNQKLPTPVLTPTTKAESGDKPLSPAELVAQGYISQEDWDYLSTKALEVFALGQELAAERGLILVDTKYEFGRDSAGRIVIVDELHTPDSSRFWWAATYQERFSQGQEPDSVDKEFLRLWFSRHCDPYADQVLPEAPKDLVAELAWRYILLYELITGKAFECKLESLEDVAAKLSAPS